MPEIIKVYKELIPEVRFIGLRYTDQDRQNGGFGHKWMEWMQKGWFKEFQGFDSKNLKNEYPDASAFIGLMRNKQGEPFEYWIGMFFPSNTPVPTGFQSVDFPKSSLGVCWVQGKENEVYMQEESCYKTLLEAKMAVKPDAQGAVWFMERYAEGRFQPGNPTGQLILDICFFVK